MVLGFSRSSHLRRIISTACSSSLRPRLNHHFSLESSVCNSQRTSKALNGAAIPRRMNVFRPAGSFGYPKTSILGLSHLINHAGNGLVRLPAPSLVSRRFFDIGFDFDSGGVDNNGSDPPDSSDSDDDQDNDLELMVSCAIIFVIILVLIFVVVSLENLMAKKKIERQKKNMATSTQSDRKND